MMKRNFVILMLFFLSCCTMAFAQKERKVSNFFHAKVWLKDGTTDEGYVNNGHHSIYVHHDIVYLSDLKGILGPFKNRKHAVKDMDSVYVWIDAEPEYILVAHPVPVMYSYGNDTPMVYDHPCLCYVFYEGLNVTIYQACDMMFGDFFLYKTPDMHYAKALFRCDKKLTKKRRATLCEEFEDYINIKNFVNTVHKNKMKDDPLAFFMLIDRVLGSNQNKRD